MDLLAWRLRWIFRRETWFLTSQLQSNFWTTELSGCLHDTSQALRQVAFPLLLPFYIAVHCPIAEFNCFTLWDSQRVIWAKPPLTLLHGQLVKFQCRVTFSFQWGSLLKDSIVMNFHIFPTDFGWLHKYAPIYFSPNWGEVSGTVSTLWWLPLPQCPLTCADWQSL